MRTYNAAGYTFQVQTSLDDVGALLERYLAPFRSPGADGGARFTVERRPGQAFYFVSVEGEEVDKALSVAWAVECVLNRVYQGILGRLEGFLGVHAAAASWRGRGLILSAPMDAGKTTLVTGLVRAGFDYLSDEMALVDPDTGVLHPFPKALTLEPPSIRLMPDLKELIPSQFEWPARLRYHFNTEDIRSGSLGAPCRVGYVIFPTYVEGAATQVQPMSRAEAAMLLVENALNFRRLRRRGFLAVATIAAEALCYRLTMGDLDSAVRTVAELVGVNGGDGRSPS